MHEKRNRILKVLVIINSVLFFLRTTPTSRNISVPTLFPITFHNIRTLKNLDKNLLSSNYKKNGKQRTITLIPHQKKDEKRVTEMLNLTLMKNRFFCDDDNNNQNAPTGKEEQLAIAGVDVVWPNETNTLLFVESATRANELKTMLQISGPKPETDCLVRIRACAKSKTVTYDTFLNKKDKKYIQKRIKKRFIGQKKKIKSSKNRKRR